MKNVSKDLRDHATEIMNCKEKIMLPLTKEENMSYYKQKFCHIFKEEFSNYGDYKRYYKDRVKCY